MENKGSDFCKRAEAVVKSMGGGYAFVSRSVFDEADKHIAESNVLYDKFGGVYPKAQTIMYNGVRIEPMPHLDGEKIIVYATDRNGHILWAQSADI